MSGAREKLRRVARHLQGNDTSYFSDKPRLEAIQLLYRLADEQLQAIVPAVPEGTLPPLDITEEDVAKAKASKQFPYTRLFIPVEDYPAYHCRERQLRALAAQLAAAQEKIREFEAISYAQYQDQMAQKSRADAAEEMLTYSRKSSITQQEGK